MFLHSLRYRRLEKRGKTASPCDDRSRWIALPVFVYLSENQDVIPIWCANRARSKSFRLGRAEYSSTTLSSARSITMHVFRVAIDTRVPFQNSRRRGQLKSQSVLRPEGSALEAYLGSTSWNQGCPRNEQWRDKGRSFICVEGKRSEMTRAAAE